MKKTLKTLLFTLCFSLVVLSLVACGKKTDQKATEGNKTSNTTEEQGNYESKNVELDLYQTKALDVTTLEGTVTYSTDKDGIVVVNGNGTVSAIGVEGTVVVTANGTNGGIKFTVKVEDSGERPIINSIEDFEVFTGHTYDLGAVLSLSYLEETITEGVTYEFSATNDYVTVDDNGVVTGAKAGVSKIQVTANYRGYKTSKKSCTVTILPATAIQVEDISLSVADNDVDPKEITLAPKAFVDGVEVDATITATLKSGSEFATLDGLTVKAVKVGLALIELSFQNGTETVTKEVIVTVHDDSVEYRWSNLQQTSTDDSEFRTVREDGPHKGEVLYKALNTGANYWNSAITDSSTVSSIVSNGYLAFSYEIYFENIPAAIHLYIASGFISESGAYARYPLSNGVVDLNSDTNLAYIFDENGENMNGRTLETNKWYKVVYDLSTYSDGWSMLGLSLDAEATNADCVSYLRNLQYHTTDSLIPNGCFDSRYSGSTDNDPDITTEKDDFINGLEIANPSKVTVSKVVSGSFKDSYKIRSVVASYEARTSFTYFADLADGGVGDFFKDGKHYIKFQIYPMVENGIGVCTWLKAVLEDDQDLKVEGSLSGTARQEYYKVYNSNGQECNLGLNAWYTVVAEFPYGEVPEWAMFYIGVPGSKYKPGVAYIKDVEFLDEAPVIEADTSVMTQAFAPMNGGVASFEKVTDEIDGVTGAYLYKPNGIWWPNCLQAVGWESTDGSYFDGNITTFKIRLAANTKLFYAFDYKNTHDAPGTANYYGGTALKFYDSNNAVLTQGQLVANVWYNVVIDGTTEKFWYFTTDEGGQVYFADIQHVESDPYAGHVVERDNVEAQFVPQGTATLVKQATAVDGVENAYLYAIGTGNWYTDCLQVANYQESTSFFKGKVSTFKLRLTEGSAFYYAFTWTNTKEGSYTGTQLKVYDATGAEVAVASMATDTWYTVVVDLKGNDTDWLWYLTTEGSFYVADLKNVDENPYSVNPIEENFTTGGNATLVEQTEAVDGVNGAYLFTGGATFYTDCLSVVKGTDGNSTLFTGKITTFKLRLTADGAFHYQINWQNTVQAQYSGTHIKFFNAEGTEVARANLVKDTWYTVVIEFGATDNLDYITTDGAGSFYIADLKNVDSNPFAVDESNIAKAFELGLENGSETLVKQKEAVGGVNDAYLYSLNGAWYPCYLGARDYQGEGSFFNGKVSTLKVRLVGSTKFYYALTWTNTFDGGYKGNAVKIYDATGTEVTAANMVGDTWYTVVIDLKGNTTDFFWYITGSDGGSMYIADLQNVEANPFAEKELTLLEKGLAADSTNFVGTLEAAQGGILYKSNGNWWTGSICVTTELSSLVTVDKFVVLTFKSVTGGEWWQINEGGLSSYDLKAASTFKIYDSTGNEVTDLTKDETYYLVIDVNAAISWVSIYDKASGNDASALLVELEVTNADPFEKTNIDKYVVAGGDFVSTLITTETVGSYLYKSNGNWWSGSLAFTDAFKALAENKFIILSFVPQVDGAGWCVNGTSGNTYQNATCYNVKFYNSNGVEVTTLNKNTSYYMVIEANATVNYISIYDLASGNDASVVISDLRVADADPYYTEPDTSVIATTFTANGDATLVKQTEAVDGVTGAYLYTSTVWYPDTLSMTANDNMTKGKITTFKIKKVSGDFFYSINYVDTFNNTYSGTQVKFYDAAGKEVTALTDGAWYTVVIDLSGTTDWFNYITINGGSAYIADLQNVEANPFVE